MDLDAAPELRWYNVTKYYMDTGVYPAMAVVKALERPPAVKRLISAMSIDEDYVREMRGIVAHVNDSRLTLEVLMAASIEYETKGLREALNEVGNLTSWNAPSSTATGCSGLLAAMPNGTVVHGRNMDYGGVGLNVSGRVLSWPDVTVEVIFVKAGKPLMTSTHWPLTTGIHTGMRFGGWSFQQNTRPHDPLKPLLNGLSGGQGFMLSARKVLETVADFETAVERLYDLNLMAPMYFVVAGTRPYQGAVITMDSGGLHLPETPPVTRLSGGSPVSDQRSYQVWHLYQSNDDMNGNPHDMRRPSEEFRLQLSTQDAVSASWAFNELHTFPVFWDDTVFTTVYIPASGYHSTVVHPGHLR